MHLVFKVMPRRAYEMANLKGHEGSGDLIFGTILSFTRRNRGRPRDTFGGLREGI